MHESLSAARAAPHVSQPPDIDHSNESRHAMFSKLTRWLDTRRRDRALRTYAIDDVLWQATLDGLPFLSSVACQSTSSIA